MSTLEGDFWVCAECRSINNARAKQCYNCRTPRDLAAVDPSTIDPTGHGKLREVSLPTYHSPRPFAALASMLIIAVAGLQVVLTVGSTSLLLQILDGTEGTEEQFKYLGVMGLITLGVGLLALVAWSLWLSRAVTSMPALGLGYPAASGLMAFVENFLPGLNLLRVPAIVRDVVRRVEPGSTSGQSRGDALIFAAWIGLLGGFVVPRIGAVMSGFSSDSPEGVIRSQLTIAGIGTGLVLVGAIFLVVLIWWIEERIDRRREAQLAAIDAAAAGATEDPAEAIDEAPSVAATPSAPPVPSPAVRVSEPTAAWSWGSSSASPLAGSTAPPTATGAVPGWPAASADAPTPAEPPPAVPLGAGWERAPIPSGDTSHRWDDRPEPPLPDAAAPVAGEPEPEPAPPEAASEPAPSAQAEPEPEPTAAAPALDDGPPHLTIRVHRMGMLQAEMAGETEPVILEDLSTYGTALAEAGGSAEIVVAADDDMARLIAKRAQRILSEAGIEVTVPD